MANAKFNPGDDRYVQCIIHRKVKQLIGRADFTQQDQESLRQELLTRVVQGLRQFRPDRGTRNAFITAIVERHVANILRNRLAPKRLHQGIMSLNVLIEVGGEGLCELAQTIGQREQDARLGQERRSAQDLADLAMDMQDVIAMLPDTWQDLLERLKYQSMSEIARDLGIPRTTLHHWMRGIRRRFEEAGMKDYL